MAGAAYRLAGATACARISFVPVPVQLHAPASLFSFFYFFFLFFAGAAAPLDQHARSHLLFFPPFFLQARLRRWKSMRADLGMSQVKLLVFLCRT